MTQIGRTSRRLRSTTAVVAVMVAAAVLVPSSAQATMTFRSSSIALGVRDGTPSGAVGGVQNSTPSGAVGGVRDGTPSGVVGGVRDGTPSGVVGGVRDSMPSGAVGGVQSSTPSGAVGGVQSPAEAGSTMSLTIDASDTGSGLASARASIAGNTASVSLCPPPASAGAAVKASPGGACPESVSNVSLPIDVGGEGSHVLLVTVTDAAGNTTTLVDETIVVESPPPPGSNTVTIGIASGGPPSSGPPEPAETGGKAGNGGRSEVSGSSSSTVCRSPLLAMRLTSRPLRYAMVKGRRIPVLLARRNYTYRGRLTCLLGGRRVSAPTGTVVHVFYKIGRHPARRSDRGTMTVHNGNLRAILGYSYTSARTIVFRYGAIDGELAQVKIPIEIAPTHPRRGRRGR